MEENQRRRLQEEKQKITRDKQARVSVRSDTDKSDECETTAKVRNEFGREMGPLDALLHSIREGNYQLKRGDA
jgi:hypothetical protein